MALGGGRRLRRPPPLEGIVVILGTIRLFVLMVLPHQI